MMIASDNTRDPFYPYGDLDMMEVWREGVRILHLDYPFADWAPAVSAAPAKAMGLDLGELCPGRPADIILTRRGNSPSFSPVRSPIASSLERRGVERQAARLFRSSTRSRASRRERDL